MLSEKKYPGLRFRSHLAPEIDERIHPVNGRFWHTFPDNLFYIGISRFPVTFPVPKSV